MHAYLEFERPIADLEGKIVELRKLAEADPTMDIEDDVGRLQSKAKQLIHDTYAKLTPWQKALVARHPARPHFLDYVSSLIDDFTPLAGDRLFGEDRAVVTGLARFRGRAVATCGPGKGQRHQEPPSPQFWHGDARGLSQDAAPVRDGEPFPVCR